VGTVIAKATTTFDYISVRFVLGVAALVLLLALYVWTGTIASMLTGPTLAPASADSPLVPAVPVTPQPNVHFY